MILKQKFPHNSATTSLTFLNLIFTFIGFVFYTDLYIVSILLNYFIIFSFHSCILFEPNCFIYMREKNGWSFYEFHLGNILLHWIPFIIQNSYFNYVTLWHVVYAHAIIIIWSFLEMKKKIFCHDHIYVSLNPKTWYLLHLIGSLSMFSYFYLYQSKIGNHMR